MNYLKASPVGIDFVIDEIQQRIYQPLVDRWGDLDVYGRVYSNVKVAPNGDEEFILERYSGNGDYEPVLFSDENKLFFIQGNNPSISFGKANNDLWVVCIVDLDSIKNTVHRADEEVHVDLLSVLSTTVPSRDIVEVQYGIENLRSLANEAFDDSNFRFSDIHPNHVFMIRLDVSYTLIENNC